MEDHLLNNWGKWSPGLKAERGDINLDKYHKLIKNGKQKHYSHSAKNEIYHGQEDSE